MSGDGAHMGVSATRALETILGLQPQPSDEERVDFSELEQRIRRHPLPGDEAGPWEMDQKTQPEGFDAYSYAAECLAHAFLTIADDDPGVLSRIECYPKDCEHESLRGKQKELDSAMWDAFKKRWPDGDDWIGGATGFMVGWAFNAVRAIKDMPPAPNPAIMTIGGDG